MLKTFDELCDEESLREYCDSEPGWHSTGGSMTTGVAAIRTGRKCICIENNEEIFNIGKNRIMKYQKEKLVNV